MRSRRNPVDLSAQMAVCDANYIRILKLLPDYTLDHHRAFGLPFVGWDQETVELQLQSVILRVTEKFKYTSTVSIRLILTGKVSDFYRPPVMLVRLYHDASTAEVVSYQDERDTRADNKTDEVPRYYPDEKEQLNLFLADWLSLCLECGLGQSILNTGSRTVSGLLPST